MFQLRIAGDVTSAQSPSCEYTVDMMVSIVDCKKMVRGAVTNLPEVLDYGILFIITSVVGVLHPIVDINLGDTTNEQLKLPLIKDVDKIGGDELVEALDEGIELLLYTLLDTPFCYESGNQGQRV